MRSPLVLLTAALSIAMASPINKAGDLEERQATIQDGNTYIISSASAPKNAIDVTNNQVGGDLISFEKHGHTNQQWTAKWLGGENEYGLISVATGEWIQVPAGENGTQLKVKPITTVADNSVRWIAQQLPNGNYVFKSKAYPSLVIDLDNGSDQSLVKVIVWQGHGRINQQWIVQPVPSA